MSNKEIIELIRSLIEKKTNVSYLSEQSISLIAELAQALALLEANELKKQGIENA